MLVGKLLHISKSMLGLNAIYTILELLKQKLNVKIQQTLVDYLKTSMDIQQKGNYSKIDIL